MTRVNMCLLTGLTLLIFACAGVPRAPEIELSHPAHANAVSTPPPSKALKPLVGNRFDANSSEKDEGHSGHQHHGVER